MQRKEVKSSAVKSVGYNEAAKVLEVQFSSGMLYQYQEVPAEVFEKLMGAESFGKAFGQLVREQFPYKQVPDVDFFVERGTYRLLRVDGTEETFRVPADATPAKLIELVQKAVGATLDTLRLNTNDPVVIMAVDDLGLEKDLPLNEKATAIYRATRSHPNAKTVIVGPAVLINDDEFITRQ